MYVIIGQFSENYRTYEIIIIISHSLLERVAFRSPHLYDLTSLSDDRGMRINKFNSNYTFESFMTLQPLKVNLANRCYLYLIMGTDATSCFALLGCLECWKLSFCSRITGPGSYQVRNDQR